MSFYANNQEHFLEARDWLARHDPTYLKTPKRIAMRVLFRFRSVATVIGKWQALKIDFGPLAIQHAQEGRRACL